MASDCSTPRRWCARASSTTGMAANWCFSTIPKRMPVSVLDFLLEVLGELLVALGGDDRQGVDVESPQAFSLLVDAEPQAASDGLAAFALGAHFAEGANLEDVRVVPALAQGRVGEDELQLASRSSAASPCPA